MNLYCFLLWKIFTPKELLPTLAIFVALKVLAFLSALLKPTAVSLFVLPPTICLAFPKCHSTVSVFIVRWFIFPPFLMQNISIAVMWPNNNDLIQNRVSSAKRLYFGARFLLIIFSCRFLQLENQFGVSKSQVYLFNAFSGVCGPYCPLQILTTPFQCVQRSQM